MRDQLLQYLVSSLTSKLDAEPAAWRTRPLDETSYPYLLVDARYEDIRSDGRVTSQGVLIIGGVRAAGRQEILAVDVADTESEATYQEQFRQLKARGLSGVEMVTSDQHRGLVAAIKRHFQGASHQRCQVHFTRDLLGMVGASRRGELAAGLRIIVAAPTLADARRLVTELADLWRATHPCVAAQVDEHIEECFACYAFPAAHRQRIRSTNGWERLMQEIKRRTRVIRIFPNRDACLRLVTALCAEQSDEWISGTRYLDVSELWRWRQGQEEEEVTLAAV